MACSALVFLRLGLYRAVVRFMGHEALVAVLKGVTISTAALCAAMVVCGAQPAPTLPVLYWALMLVCVGGTRLALRSWYRNTRRRGERPVAIYGAGAAGRQLLTALRHSEHYVPVVFVDDATRLQGRVVSGVPVVSAFALAEMIERHEVAEVFLAIASANPVRRREIIRALAEFPVQVRSIPRLEELLSGRATIAQVEEISLADLLGREPVPPRHELLAPRTAGKVVMVTGAGGSIGSELCRQLLAEEPGALLLLDSSEYALYAIERELAALLAERQSSLRLLPVLGNVRDAAHMALLFRRFGVQAIYHAAAYKHVPLVEYNVVEGLRNNALGTLALARAAAAAGVETFVLVSTDKAVRPANAMGASKRVAELVMQALAAERAATRFVIVRFGNVIGSSGSVIPLFREQIARGGPVTVTHELAERYFMTIPE
ncbi:MAG: polysaccharide biosynthesis protein, partial [Gammaproteobacteria bacterium]